MSAHGLDAARRRAGLHQIVIQVTEVRQNCSIIWCGETMRGAVIDPGGDLDQILMAAEAEDVVVDKILITHGHRDHCGGAADLAAELQVPIAASLQTSAGQPMLGPPRAGLQTQLFLKQAYADIPMCVQAIRQHYRFTRYA